MSDLIHLSDYEHRRDAIDRAWRAYLARRDSPLMRSASGRWYRDTGRALEPIPIGSWVDDKGKLYEPTGITGAARAIWARLLAATRRLVVRLVQL